MLAKIFGAYPTPKVVYNAIPWSWLVDWFLNAGHVISNLDVGVAERLVAEYNYVMRHQQNESRLDVSCEFCQLGTKGSEWAHCSTSRIWSRKTRTIGSPFRLSIDQDSLSDMQWSILGALGLSRLKV